MVVALSVALCVYVCVLSPFFCSAVCDADYYFSPDDLACLKCGQTTTISPTLVLFVLAIILVFLFAIINKLATNGKITTLTSEEELEAHIKKRTKRAGEALAGALDARLFGKDGAKHIKVDLATRSASITKTFTVASAKENTDKKTVTETASVPGAIITASCATRSIDPQLEMTVKIKVVPTSGLGVIVHYVKELQVQVKGEGYLFSFLTTYNVSFCQLAPPSLQLLLPVSRLLTK